MRRMGDRELSAKGTGGGGELERASQMTATDYTSCVPTKVGSLPAEAGSEPAEAGSEPAQAGSEPAEAGSEAAQAGDGRELSAAQRARSERNRLRARALQDARLVHSHPTCGPASAAVDSGGGFLLDAPGPAPPAPRAAPAPVVHRPLQPRCERCALRFPQSHLLDTFDLSVCDACRDDDDADELVTRTEAKAAYLLQDCDLDAREPPLRCLRRRNPHSARYGDMRLYLRAQAAARALLVWGSEGALEEERARRGAARERAAHARTHRRLRALRMDVRSGLYRRDREPHAHAFGPETHDAAADLYRRECTTCGHEETYEKM